MAEDDLDVVRDQYDAVNERDWRRAMGHYADDVRLIVGPPYINSGTFEGAEAIGEWFGDWMSQFGTDLRFEITELAELDDGRVLLVADVHARGRASGAPVVGQVIWAYRLSGGKITEVTSHETREQAVG
jgi:ketosteroid isomerase-like protein